MSEASPVPGWYHDPELPGGLRYWDGGQWTQYRSADYYPNQFQTYKGVKYGLPIEGSGALAPPKRRLAARTLDSLLWMPAFTLVTFVGLFFLLPNSDDHPNFLWLFLAFWFIALLMPFVAFVYEGVMTAKYGRTLGKRWMGIRPIRTNGEQLKWGRSFGRPALYYAFTFVPYVGYIDILWCLWDSDRQCLHDKVAGTLVIND